MSAICGGVMSLSQLKRGMKKHGVYYGMMASVMADDKFKEYQKLLKAGKEKEAHKFLDKYARSQI